MVLEAPLEGVGVQAEAEHIMVVEAPELLDKEMVVVQAMVVILTLAVAEVVLGLVEVMQVAQTLAQAELESIRTLHGQQQLLQVLQDTLPVAEVGAQEVLDQLMDTEALEALEAGALEVTW